MLVDQFRPRDVLVVGPCQPPLRIYSDASFGNGILRLGWNLLPPTGRGCGGTTVVPEPVIHRGKPRHQQIFPGESLCALVIPVLYPDVLNDQDIVWFIDNEAAGCFAHSSVLRRN